VENPFRYGEIVSGSFFTDRERELAELELDIRSGQNVAIISPRRFGKTSLVVQAIEHLRRQEVLVAYVDLYMIDSKVEFASHLTTALYSGLVAPFGRAVNSARSFVSKFTLKPRITVSPEGEIQFEISGGQAGQDIDRTIEELLALPDRIARSRKKRVAVVMDEFQQVVDVDEHLPAVIRAIFQTQSEVSHVFLGSKRSLMRKVFTDENEPMYRMAKPMVLEEIEAGLFASFIGDRFRATGITVSEDAISRILKVTGCHPHDTQELAHFTWSLAYLDGSAVTPDLVDHAFASVLKAEGARFSELWDRLPPSQRLLLKALAVEGDTGIYSEEYRLRHALGAPTTVQKAVSALVEKDLVETGETGDYRIPNLLLREWIARYRQTREVVPSIRKRTRS
jgi:uncharacterized protein